MSAKGIFEGARIAAPEDVAAITLSKTIGHVVGTTPTLIARPSSKDRVLYLLAEDGDYRVRPGDYVARAFAAGDVTPASDSITITDHGYETGDGPVRLTSDGVDPPDPLEVDTDYWVIAVDADTIKLASSRANADAGTAVPLADAGTGNFELGGPSDGAGSGKGWGNAAEAATATSSYGSIRVSGDAASTTLSRVVVVAAPEKLTVVGYGTGPALTYWFGG